MKIIIGSEKNNLIGKILNQENIGLFYCQNNDELFDEIKNAEVLIPERLKVTKETICKAPSLKLIQCGTGYNNVDLESATANGIYVANTPNVASQSVAEHVFALINELYKKTGKFDASMKQGEWDKSFYGNLYELHNKIIGIIGYGNIGKKVAKIADAYNMKVLFCCNNNNNNNNNINNNNGDRNFKQVSIERLLAESDIITLHVPLNEDTLEMIGYEELKLMKRSAYLINTSRGRVVDENALIDALVSNSISGAGIDVFNEEPLNQVHALRRCENVVLTPHIAYHTIEGLSRRYEAYAENIKRIREGSIPNNIVNNTKVD